jgi:GDSL-like Lipase/Acylhydrolase family
MIIGLLIGLAVALEIGLRLVLGLGNPPLYIADREIGYLLAPNQQLRRMGNSIKVNQYSMRSENIATKKANSTRRILLLGDSIVNGAWWTDQQETLSALLATRLQAHSRGRSIEVLNASANSWGPRNELAYLKRFGLFDAEVLILVINTDDLFATAPTSLPVGRERNYPDQAPALALIELYQHYLAKPQPISQLQKVKQEGGDRVGANLEAIKEIKAIAEEANIKLILAMTPLLREFQGDGSRDYELKARKRLQEFTTAENIVYLDFLSILADFPQPEFLYRDHIHPSPQGNKLVSETLYKSLQTELKFRE